MTSSIVNSITTTPKKQKIRGVVRNAIEQDWIDANPVPDKGEIVYTSDTNTLKVGDGINKYVDLPTIAGGGGGGTDNYNELLNKPQVNGTTLSGNKSSSDLGLATSAQGALADTALQPGDNISELVNDSGFITGINSSDVTSALGYTPVDPSDLSTVATTGNYNDLSNKPTIPAPQVNSDWNASSGVAQILNKPTIPDTSNMVTTDTTQTISGEKTFSGIMNYSAGKTYILAGNGGTKLGYWSYDIDGQSNITLQTMTASTRNINFKTNNGGKVTYNGSEIAKKSEIPTVNDPTIVITQGGVTKGSFSLNQTTGDTIALDAGGLIGDFVPQYTTMPTADISHADQIVQYKGVTDSTYTNGYFYKCVEEGGVYSWSQVSVQPGTSDYSTLSNKPSINSVTLTGNKTSADLGILSDVTQGSNITIDKTNPSNPVISATGQVNADWNSTSGLSEILNKPTLGTMAAENANDYTPTSGLATVATSGSYNDLSNKPTIPAAQVNSDWNANSGVAQILNKPTLAAVATSGSYNDLSNKPTIPSVYNPTITITQGGVTKGSFTLNQSTGDTIALDAGGSAIPSTSGQAGKFLTNDGTDLSWGTATVVNFKEWGANE